MNQALLRFKRNPKKLLKLRGCVLETLVVALRVWDRKPASGAGTGGRTHGWPVLLDEGSLP